MNIKNPKKILAFNVIEIMVALSILCIIMVFSISQYNSYHKRARLTAAMEVANNIKEKVMLMYVKKEAFPNSNDESLGNLLNENYKKYISSAIYNQRNQGLEDIINVLPSNIVANIQLELITKGSNTIKLYYIGINNSSTSSSGELVEEEIQWDYFLTGENYKYLGTSQRNLNTITIRTVPDCSQSEYLSGGACLPCIPGATCSQVTIVACNKGYYGVACNYLVSSCNGYVTGSGSQSSCSSCPANATCSQGVVTACSNGYLYYKGTCVASSPNSSHPLKINCNFTHEVKDYGHNYWVFVWYDKCSQYSTFLNNGTPVCDPCNTYEHYLNPSWYFCGCILPSYQGVPNGYVTWITGPSTDCNQFCSGQQGYSIVGPFC